MDEEPAEPPTWGYYAVRWDLEIVFWPETVSVKFVTDGYRHAYGMGHLGSFIPKLPIDEDVTITSRISCAVAVLVGSSHWSVLSVRATPSWISHHTTGFRCHVSHDIRLHVETFSGHHQIPKGLIMELKSILQDLSVGRLSLVEPKLRIISFCYKDTLASDSSTSPFDQERLSKYLGIVRDLGGTLL